MTEAAHVPHQFVLTPPDEAEARAGAHALMAELLSRGVTRRTWAAARQSALLRGALAGYTADDDTETGRPTEAVLDAAAADHQRAFGFEVFPFEGVFLDPAGQVGGPATAALTALYRRMGFAPDPRDDGPEHLATELRALALLSGTEAAALASGDGPAAHRARELARELLDGHVLRFLPTFAAAVRRLGLAFPAALVDQIEQLVLLHREGLGEPASASFELAGEPVVLADDVGLGQLARALTSPARAGLFLSRADIAAVGRATGVPRGFGERATLLHNLLRTANDLDQLPAVVDALRARLRDACAELGAQAHATPWLAPIVAPHRDRIAGTGRALAVLAERARQPVHPEPPGG